MKKNSLVKMGIFTLFIVVGGLSVTVGLASAEVDNGWRGDSLLCKASAPNGSHKSFVVLGKSAFWEGTDCGALKGPTKVIGDNKYFGDYVDMITMNTCDYSDWHTKMCETYDRRITQLDVLAVRDDDHSCLGLDTQGGSALLLPVNDCLPLTYLDD